MEHLLLSSTIFYCLHQLLMAALLLVCLIHQICWQCWHHWEILGARTMQTNAKAGCTCETLHETLHETLQEGKSPWNPLGIRSDFPWNPPLIPYGSPWIMDHSLRARLRFDEAKPRDWTSYKHVGTPVLHSNLRLSGCERSPTLHRYAQICTDDIRWYDDVWRSVMQMCEIWVPIKS